ncbi:hypothetical protein ACFLXK_05510 [Chloroflexota bacterium]
MFRWLSQPWQKSKKKTEQSQPKESRNLVRKGKATQQAPSDEVRTLLKRAIADAEELTASIKMRAQTEAEAEATRIIAQAKLEGEEIKGKAEMAAQKQAEDIPSAAKRKARITKAEAKLAAKEEALEEKVEEPATLQEETLEEKMEEPATLQEETLEEKMEEPATLQEETLEEKMEEPATLQEETLEERSGGVEVESALPKLDSQALYTGEVELTIASQAELPLVSRLYNHLQTIPELKILYTKGSWDQGTTITVVLEQQMPLISILLQTPGVAVTPELLERGVLARGKADSPLRGGEMAVKRIKLILKEA